jgi:hypothetical protein
MKQGHIHIQENRNTRYIDGNCHFMRKKHAFQLSDQLPFLCPALSLMQELHLVQDQLSIEQTRASKFEVGNNNLRGRILAHALALRLFIISIPYAMLWF